MADTKQQQHSGQPESDEITGKIVVYLPANVRGYTIALWQIREIFQEQTSYSNGQQQPNGKFAYAGYEKIAPQTPNFANVVGKQDEQERAFVAIFNHVQRGNYVIEMFHPRQTILGFATMYPDADGEVVELDCSDLEALYITVEYKPRYQPRLIS